MAEQRNFRMDPSLLLKVIKQQAGSLSKAVMEGVMNAADAGATECRINLTHDTLRREDDGRGFRDREEIQNFFEVFGKPHEENEGKIYGEFRMGRGQLFAFGRNEWRTTRFRMRVDIKDRGLSYDLEDDLKPAKGCRITVTLYSHLGLAQQVEIRRDIERWLQYAPVDTYYNGNLVSKNPRIEDWTKDTPFAYVRINKTDHLSVFNVGVHVCDIPKYKIPGQVGGVVISKEKLSLNFARNEVMSDCPVWKKIKGLLQPKEKKPKSDGAKVQAVITGLRDGTVKPASQEHRGLFMTASGRRVSADNIWRCYKWQSYTWIDTTPEAKEVDPDAQRLATLMQKKGISLCFTSQTLEEFDCDDVQELLQWVKKTFPADYERKDACKKLVKEFPDLRKGFDSEYTTLDESELTSTEKMWIALLSNTSHKLVGKGIGSADDRPINIGTHASQMSWTDGSTYITLNRKLFQKRDFDVAGIYWVGRQVAHAVAHLTPDLELKHRHDGKFYKRYYILSASLGKFTDYSMRIMPRLAEDVGKRLTRQQTYKLDADHRVAKAVDLFTRKAVEQTAKANAAPK